MKLKEFLKIVNYENFCVSREIDGQLTVLCRLNQHTPIKCLSDKLLDSEIETMFPENEYKGIPVSLVIEEDYKGTAGSVKNSVSEEQETVLVINTDSYFVNMCLFLI